MDKVRIKDVADELGIKSKEVIEKATELGLEVKAASSVVTPDDAEKLMNYVLTGVKEEVTPSAPSVPEVKSPKEEKPKVEATPKKEKKTAPPKKVEVVQEPKEKVEEKVKEEPKVETPEPKKERPKESLAQASVTKRRGLVIVKKKRPQKTEEPKAEPKEEIVSPYTKKKNAQPLESVFASEATKKKKKVKKTPAEKKSGSEKMDISFGSDIADVSINYEEEMVVLPDFSIKQEPQVEVKKKKDPNQIRTTNKKSAFVQQGIQRTSRKKRPKKVVETKQEIKSVEIPEEIRVYEFAEKIGKQASDVIKELFLLGMMVTKNDFLDKDFIEILAETFEIEVTTVNAQEEFDYVKAYHEDEDVELEQELQLSLSWVTLTMGKLHF